MITQDRLWRSPRSRPMVGSALATIVWFTAERKPPSIRPWKMRWISFLVSGATWAWLSVRSLNELIAFVFLRLYSRYFSLFLVISRYFSRLDSPAACNCHHRAASKQFQCTLAGRWHERNVQHVDPGALPCRNRRCGVVRRLLCRAAQRLRLDGDQCDERDAEKQRGGDEHEAERPRKRRSASARACELVEREGSCADAAEHDRGEDCDDERTAELTKEAERAGRDAELMQRHGVLDDDCRGRPHRADAGAADREQRRHLGERELSGRDREHRERSNANRHGEDRHKLVALDPRNQMAR